MARQRLPRKKKSSAAVFQMGNVTPEKVRETAYFIWEQKGKPQGSEVDDWTEAEKQLKSTSL